MRDGQLVYLDHNSTTPVAPEVVSVITESLQEDWANPSSHSAAGCRARKAIHRARLAVAQAIHADVSDIIFTSGGTESNNMAILSAVEWGKQFTTTPHVILSNVEHVATSAPVKRLAEKGIISFTQVPVNNEGCLEAADVIAAIRPETVLVTVMMANNETGVVFPIEEIARQLKAVNEKRKRRVLFHVDAAQAVGKILVDVDSLGVDYLTIVGHKFYGPRIGALYARRVPDGRAITPVVWGGGQEQGLRPGTENTPMIAGLGRAAELVTENLHKYEETMKRTRNYLEDQLEEKTGCVVNCWRSPRLPNTASVAWPQCRASGSDILASCPSLVASTTAACHDQTQLSEVLLASGVPKELALSTIRLSVGRGTTFADIDIAVAELVKAIRRLS